MQIGLFLPLRWWIRIIIVAVLAGASYVQSVHGIPAVTWLWETTVKQVPVMLILIGVFAVSWIHLGFKKKTRGGET